MAQVEFLYNGVMTIVQCQESQKMEEICKNFINKSKANESEIYYFYDGRGGIQFNKNLTFNQMANSFDKIRKKMSVLVYDKENMNNDKSIIKSKNIICPECNEKIKINIKDYKINLFECKNKHKINKIFFNEFDKTQMIDLTKIKCGKCKEKTKSDTFNNEFYKCYECNINLCPLCKTQHNNSHNIYNHDKINYICNKHNESLTNYCKKCNKNICFLCDEEHFGHEIISLGKMMINKNELITKLEGLKKSISIFNENINIIIEKLNNIKEYMSSYYKLEEYIINNYATNERNYEKLYNIIELTNFNNIIINDINNIDNEQKIENKFNNIFNIYNQINKNEIKLLVKIEKKDINKKVYFLDNTDGKVPIYANDLEEHHHDFLKELNETNVELYINNIKNKYQKYFIPKKEGIYEIILKSNILLTDTSYMFARCSNIINIDLSSFNTKRITNMYSMFACCSNLKSINLSLFDTKNVNNIGAIFQLCSSLTNIDLSSFNTENVINMSCMFNSCSNLTKLDLSTLNTTKVTDMSSMFGRCSNLVNIDLSLFNTEKVNDMNGMFNMCTNLTNINLSSFNIEKVNDMKGMFFGCSSLKNIDLSSFIIENITKIDSIFKGCTKLNEIKLNKNSKKNITNEIDTKKIKIIYI